MAFFYGLLLYVNSSSFAQEIREGALPDNPSIFILSSETRNIQNRSNIPSQ